MDDEKKAKTSNRTSHGIKPLSRRAYFPTLTSSADSGAEHIFDIGDDFTIPDRSVFSPYFELGYLR